MANFPKRLIQKLFGIRLVDSVFGAIRFTGNGMWSGESSVAGRLITVDVFADEHGPSDEQRKLFLDVMERFASLRSDMAVALFAEYESIRSAEQSQRDLSVPGGIEDFDSDYPPVQEPQDIWSVASLFRIEIYGNTDVDVGFDHMIRWADDHQLNVFIKDWKVLEVAYEG